jgi:ATP-binding cassette subfamily B multidrug efflux pump
MWKPIPMFGPIFRWFETRIDPYAAAEIVEPPSRLCPFFWHFLKPVWWAFALLTVLTLVAAAIEVAILAFIGRVIDLMKETASPASFFTEHGTELALMALVALIARPLVSALPTSPSSR